jgi:hypothetical protein
MKSTAFTRIGWLVVVLLAVSPAWSQAGGSCVSAEIPWQMEMPDGSVHKPGQVSLCYVRNYNPVSGLHALKVNGMPLGTFQSTVARSEEQESLHPILVFKSDGAGHVRLVAYAWPTEQAMEVYWLHQPGESLSQVRQASMPIRTLQREQDYYVVAASRGY